MTLNELKSAVSALLSEAVSERDPVFLGATNRSLEMLFAELPVRRCLILPVKRSGARLLAEKIEHAGGEKTVVSLVGNAYSFKVSGVGSYTVRDDDGEITRDFDTPISTIRGFIKGKSEIIFEGDCRYTVFALTAFDGVSGKRLEDIPDTVNEGVILADDYAEDILSLSELPRDLSGRVISGARIEGRSIIFPKDYSGIATLLYERRPMPVTESTAFIDAEPDAITALPLLVAYFLTLEEDSARAGEYLAIAKSSIKTMLARRAHSRDEYTDVTRWA